MAGRVVLSGDLHHMSLRTGNQAHCDISEIQVAQRYMKLLEEAQVKVTFFVSGKSFAEEWPDLQNLVSHPLVEVGGHNYYCFKPAWWHRGWKKLTGSYNGPAWYQEWETNRTIQVIERRAGKRIRCWRNHMYMHGPYTERVLRRCGIPICSDGVVRGSRGPRLHSDGIYNFPLNVMPDHEHLYHAERTPEYVDWFVRRYNWSDDYGSASYHIEEWTDRVVAELLEHRASGSLANMLIHPITLYLCDRFRSFRRILDVLATSETLHMTEVVPFQAGTSPENVNPVFSRIGEDSRVNSGSAMEVVR